MQTKLIKYILLLLTVMVLNNCDLLPTSSQQFTDKPSIQKDSIKNERESFINTRGRNIQERILSPKGFQRTTTASSSFANFLRNLPLKADSAEVRYFNGATKSNDGSYVAVVNLPIGNKDLHQCADAVMRLRARYLYQQKKYDQIQFNFTNGFKADYSTWRAGKRIKVSGNEVYWVQQTNTTDIDKDFWKYLEMVFTYAGTHSLSKELEAVPINKMQIGDVFIQGGFPGHAIIVVDMIEDSTTGKQLFLLAQSYMPAQEIHILSNPANSSFSPWYSLELGETLFTPDWNFTKDDLKRFRN